MPELSEVRLMSDYINHCAQDTLFQCEELEIFEPTQIKSFARGKELKIQFGTKSLFMSLGMTGNFLKTTLVEIPNHTRFSLISEKFAIRFIDTRRFAKWRWDTDWSKKRGPCPVTEYIAFKQNLKLIFHNPKILKKLEKLTIAEFLLDQKYFNGIGNYLRAEILYRLKLMPTANARIALRSMICEIPVFCRGVANEAYELGGGQLKDWKNPEGKSAEDFKKWLKVYGKGESYYDKNGRRVWWDSTHQTLGAFALIADESKT